MSGRSAAARSAPVATTLLGGLLVWAAVSPAPVPYARPLVAVLAVVALGSAARLATTRCIESRVAASAVGFATVLGVALASTIGLPGAGSRPVDPPAVVLVLTALLAMALVAVPQPTRSTEDDPYAS